MFFCAAWDCVSTGIIAWKSPVNDDLITVTRVPQQQLASNLCYGRCSGFLFNPVQVTFTEKGKKKSKIGKQGTARDYGCYQSGHDQGLVFTLKTRTEPIPGRPHQLIGPNQILALPKLATSHPTQDP